MHCYCRYTYSHPSCAAKRHLVCLPTILQRCILCSSTISNVSSPGGQGYSFQWIICNSIHSVSIVFQPSHPLVTSNCTPFPPQVGLRQRHLVLQVLTATSHDKPFSLELGLTDAGGTRRRLVLSSSFRALHCTPLHAQVGPVRIRQRPLPFCPRFRVKGLFRRYAHVPYITLVYGTTVRYCLNRPGAVLILPSRLFH